ncbi:Ig-like domain-containing protein, partial [Frigoribacterium sp. Leaf164]|uniref:Ig-like domain-containing protein n=1 Tax=Frigoribacterium sp. Leaf164 TaxID=1736282 RepID=UPI000AC7F331
MSTIRTGLAAVGLAALAAGTLAPAAALAAPAATTDVDQASAASQPTASAPTAAPAAPRIAFVEQGDDGELAVAGLAPGARLAGIDVEGGGRYTAAVWDDRFATSVDLADLGKPATLMAYTPQGRVEVEFVLELQHAEGEDRAPGTPVVHAVSQYDDDHLVIEGTVAHEPDLFTKTEVWASRSGASWDFPSDNGAFSLVVPASRAGETIDVTAYYRGRASEATPVVLVPTERNTASDTHPLQLASPAQGEVVAEPAPTFAGTGIPNSQIVVTRDGETARSTATLCETRVAVTGDWSCTSAALPAGSYETTVVETPTWASAAQQRAGASFTVADTADGDWTPALPMLSSVTEDADGQIVLRGISTRAAEARIEVGDHVETVRAQHGRFTFILPAGLAGQTATITGISLEREGRSLDAPLTPLEAPEPSPLTAPTMHAVFPASDGSYYIQGTASYFATEWELPGVIAQADGVYVDGTETTWNGAFMFNIGAEHAGEQIDLITVRSLDMSERTTITLVETEGSTAPADWPLNVVSPADGETIAADTATLTGVGIPGSTVEVTTDTDGVGVLADEIGKADVLADGTWTVEVDAPLAEGDHTMTVTETPYWENLDPIVSTRSF